MGQRGCHFFLGGGAGKRGMPTVVEVTGQELNPSHSCDSAESLTTVPPGNSQGVAIFLNRVPSGALKRFRPESVQVDKLCQLKTDFVCCEDRDSSPTSCHLGPSSPLPGCTGATSFLCAHLLIALDTVLLLFKCFCSPLDYVIIFSGIVLFIFI